MTQLIETWWQKNFPNQKLETITSPTNGINYSFVLNEIYFLKILKRKDPSHTEKQTKGTIYRNYQLIQNSAFTQTPKILKVENSNIFETICVLQENIQNTNDLFELYHKLDISKKRDYLQDFIDLIKNFHNSYPGQIHGDLHFGNVLVEDEGKMYLIDFDNMESGQPFDEFYGLIQGLLLPSCCVSQDLEQYYQQPMIVEFEEVIRQYPELLPKERIEDAKQVFRDCFDHKLKYERFRKSLDPLYKKVFEDDWFEGSVGNDVDTLGSISSIICHVEPISPEDLQKEIAKTFQPSGDK